MPNIVRINVDGTMNDIKITITTLKTIIKQLDKISSSKGTTDLKQLYRWNYLDKEIYCYGWYDGDAGFENKHDLLPNGNSSFLCDEDSSEKLLFGDLFILSLNPANKKIVDFHVSDYGEVYSTLFEGFDDCETSDGEYDSEEETEEDKNFINDEEEESEEENSDNSNSFDEEELDEDFEEYTTEEEDDLDVELSD